jgi:anti-sigma regulatory factor (Ser/Thr protein kinase)
MASGPATLRAAIDLPSEQRSVPAARRVVGQLLDAWAASGFRDDATLLVSELVTNVVRHVAGKAAMRVEVQLSEPGLRVAVVDRSPARPTVRGRGADGGHGIWLVSAVADRWGSEEHGGGKRVWFELEPDRARSHPSAAG